MERLTYTCSMGELGAFDTPDGWSSFKDAVDITKSDIEYELNSKSNELIRAFIANTTSDQTHAVKALKALRFKPVGKYRGNSGMTVTVWLKVRK